MVIAGQRMILALAGGVGGAKLAHGLARILSPDELLIAVNTGDDFVHLGLHVSPDLDSVMYKLAGLNDPVRGWGLAGESWHFMDALGRLGGESWFNLGDRDLATHVERTRRLAAGETLSSVTAALCGALGIRHRVVPMSDDPVRTIVLSGAERIPFQDYFVRLNCAPAVGGFVFEGATAARPSAALAEALADPALDAIVICPSNPFVSIAPIMALPAMAEAFARRGVPIVAVTPIIGGTAVKGPAAKMMAELGVPPSASAIAAHYGASIDGFVVDAQDAAEAGAVEALGTRALVVPTLMRTADDERRLAEDTLRFARALRPRHR
jgi:LPPG:FO 2-phospho-L-lactate transferase